MWKTKEDYEKMRDSILWVESQFIKIKKRIKVGKIKQVVEKIKTEENLTTSEVLTKYPDLARLLEQEEQQEKLNESASERVLLKG
jgi:hypothetical protein